MHPKFKNAYLKLAEAAEPIAKINKILREEHLFTYVQETNAKTRRRSLFARQNQSAVDAIGLAAGNAFFNIRAALDYGYWQVVSPFVTDEKKRRQIQFPMCREASRLDDAVKNRLAHLVSKNFFDTIVALRPHGEPGGNKLLYALEKGAAPDRHKDLTPVGDYKSISAEIIKRQVPDFPFDVINIGIGSWARDFQWPIKRLDVRSKVVGKLMPGSFFVFEKELDVPIEVIFVITEAGYRGPVIPTLHELCDLVKDTLSVMEGFA